MIEGIFGNVEVGRAVGWAYDTEIGKSVSIVVKNRNKVIAQGIADLDRPDLMKVAAHINGKAGFRINLPKGRKNWTNIDIYANGTKLPKSPQLNRKIETTHRTLTLEMDAPHFFIHVPKTAGTAFKRLLEVQFEPHEIFPSKQTVLENNGLYPHFNQIIKYDAPAIMPKILIGHYPYATQQVIKGPVNKTVILRDPVDRAISNLFHMKNNDQRMKGLNPMEIYKRGKFHYSNLQVRYLADKGINLNMRFIDGKPMHERDLKSAIINLRSCQVVGISEQLDKSVRLANKVYGWTLESPRKVNIARSEKTISKELHQLIVRDNTLEQQLYRQAMRRFDNLCNKHGVE